MKQQLIAASIVALASSIALPASAALIFGDEFDRRDDNTVGNGWVELERDSNDVAIKSGALRLRDDRAGSPDAAASLFSLATTGYQNITLSYRWRVEDDDSGGNDYLYSAWKLSSATTWTTLLSHRLNKDDDEWFLASIGLGDIASDTLIDFRFWTDIDDEDDDLGARIDYLRLSGELMPLVEVSDEQSPETAAIEDGPLSPAQAVPAPGTLALLGLGLFGLGTLRRGAVA